MPIATRLKKPAHYKKRQALHHNKHKRYVKAYLPYLPLLGLAALLCLPVFASRPRVLGATSDFSESRLLDLTNTRRIEAGADPLHLDPALNAAATAKAQDLVAHNYWAHTSPQGKTPWAYINGAGYAYQSAGENLAYGFTDADEVVSGWMNSPEHRANMESTAYQDVGFGLASAPNYLGGGPATVVVAEFAQPVNAAANIHFQVAPHTLHTSRVAQVQGAQTEIASRPVARVQLLTAGRASWSLLLCAVLVGAAATLMVLRYGFRVQRMLSRGEAFVSHHPWLDVLFICVLTAGYFLTRTSGFVR